MRNQPAKGRTDTLHEPIITSRLTAQQHGLGLGKKAGGAIAEIAADRLAGRAGAVRQAHALIAQQRTATPSLHRIEDVHEAGTCAESTQ